MFEDSMRNIDRHYSYSDINININETIMTKVSTIDDKNIFKKQRLVF